MRKRIWCAAETLAYGAYDSISCAVERSNPKRVARVLGLVTILFAAMWEFTGRYLEETFQLNNVLYILFDFAFLFLTGYIVYVAIMTMAARKNQAIQAMRASTIDFIQRLGQLSSWRDDETGDHAERVGHYCAAIARELNCDTDQVHDIKFAGMLHDIGKIAMPDQLLLKENEFSVEDRALIQSHTLLGSEIFIGSDEPILKMAKLIAMSHHEWWDGTGYPYGLTEIEIPMEARIAAVADVFDALTTKRRYKEAFAFEESVRIVESLSGTQFDPDVVRAFKSGIAEIKRIYIRHKVTPASFGIHRAS